MGRYGTVYKKILWIKSILYKSIVDYQRKSIIPAVSIFYFSQILKSIKKR